MYGRQGKVPLIFSFLYVSASVSLFFFRVFFFCFLSSYFSRCTSVLPFLSLVVSGLVKIIQLLGASSSSHPSMKGQVREGEKSVGKQEQGGDNSKNRGGERAGRVDDDHVENKNASSDTVKRSLGEGSDELTQKDDENEGGESQMKSMKKRGDLELLLLPLIQAVVQQARLDESRAKTITKAVM